MDDGKEGRQTRVIDSGCGVTLMLMMSRHLQVTYYGCVPVHQLIIVGFIIVLVPSRRQPQPDSPPISRIRSYIVIRIRICILTQFFGRLGVGIFITIKIFLCSLV
jgi:hypothetical protein